VQEPADVDGELLRFRARQQHAEIQCVQNRALSIQRFFSTNSVCIMAI